MDITIEILNDITTSVWESMLQMTATPSEKTELTGRQLTSCVHISGGWSGTVTVRAGYDLASKLAEAMFMMEPGEAGDADVRDAFGEVANMVGGNVKTMAPDARELSLPVVTDGDAVTLPRAELEHEAHFTCDGGAFIVSVYRKPELAAAKSDDAVERECKSCGVHAPHRKLPETRSEDRFDDLVVEATVKLYLCLRCSAVEPEVQIHVADDAAQAQPQKANGVAALAGTA